MAEGKHRCLLCGEELRLSYAIASNKTEGNKQKRHSYCRCGVWFPLMDASEEALSAAQQRWQEPETPESQNPDKDTEAEAYTEAMQRWQGSSEEIAVEPKYKYWPVKISRIEVKY